MSTEATIISHSLDTERINDPFRDYPNKEATFHKMCAEINQL